MSIPSIVYKAHATGNDFVVYLDEDGTPVCATAISASAATA